ncbi:MAG TPA: PAS domain S-box protein [Chloroflexota bacterium]|nr:PAS domain S-box protein [Chloroflexota bacterium]
MVGSGETPLRPETFGIGRLFWMIRDAVVVGNAATGRIVLWNPAAEEMFGYRADEVLDQPIEMLVPADLRGAHRAGLAGFHRTGHGKLIDRGAPVELPAIHKSGAQLWIELSLNPIPRPDGEGQFVLAIIRDVTTRRRVEVEQRQLARAEALAIERSAILDQIAEGVIIADPDGRITFVNAAAQRIHGSGQLSVAVEDYATAYGLRTLDGQPYPTDNLPLARAVRDGETVLDARWRIERPDGTEVVAEGSATPVVAPDGSPLGSVLVMRDVTAQVALEREKDDFLAAASHDLKSPLAAIQGTAQLLQRLAAQPDGVAAERLQSGLESIERATKRMNGMLGQLLDLTRLSLDRPLELQLRPTDLVAAAGRVVQEQQSTTERHRLRLESAEPSLIGNWDAPRLERIIINLLENAVKYSPAGGDVIVRVDSHRDVGGGVAVIEVTDYGLGIPADDLPHVFERFRRGTNAERSNVPGSGIGLSAVRQIVEQMQGSIEATSEEGSGSTFTVRLPLDASPVR